MPRVVSCGALALACLGCSNYAQPHQPYAPLLHRGGQLDLAVGVGTTVHAGAYPSISARGAVSPVDHLVVVVGGDFQPPLDVERPSGHTAGEVGVGAFVAGDPHLRAEVVAAIGGGYASGSYESEDGDPERLQGPYLRPHLQGAIAGVWDWFSWGGGVRLAGTCAWLTVLPDLFVPLHQSGFYAQAVIDPFTTFRIHHESFIVELTGGASVVAFGDNLIGTALAGFVSLTFHARFDLWPSRDST